MEKYIHKKNLSRKMSSLPSCLRHIVRLIHKLRLNTWNTKYSHGITCVCRENISVHHLLFECSVLTTLYQEKGIEMSNFDNVSTVLYGSHVAEIAMVISQSPVAKCL
uniref:Conotoxin-like unassigned superfamily 17 n=1 Tax=Conus ermineus TaxID=55423 RepID=A0A346CJH4_CONER|nr:conotoxin-like precursor unassigned superfamily 17 [Conus ermineus]